MRLAGQVFTVNSRGEDRLVYNGTTGVLRVNGTKTDESRKLLVERVAASRYISVWQSIGPAWLSCYTLPSVG